MEGGVYKASWKKEPGKFTIRIKGYTALVVTKTTYEDAETAILDLITEKLGDGEAYLEFDKPLPGSATTAPYTNPDIVSIVGNECAETIFDPLGHFSDDYAKELNAYFRNGVCPECLSPLGPRNNRQMIFKYITGDGCFVSYGTYGTRIFSEAFIKSIGLHRDKRIRLIPIKTVKKTRKKYFEIAGRARYEFIGNKDLQPSGWKCGKCGSSFFGYHINGTPISHFIHLKGAVQGFFLCGDKARVYLCTTRSNWLKKRKPSSSKGIITDQIGVIRDRRKMIKVPALKVEHSAPEKPLSKRRKKLRDQFLRQVAEDKLKAER